MDRGLVIPAEDLGEGRGKVKRYSSKNLVDFFLIKELADWGMTVSKIKKVLDYANDQSGRDFDERFLPPGEPSFLIIYKMRDGRMLAKRQPRFLWETQERRKKQSRKLLTGQS